MSPRPEEPAALRRRCDELAAMYEVARDLIGATSPTQVAYRVVLSGMGVIGAGSGSLFIADERGRYRLIYASRTEIELDETIRIPAEAQEWMLRRGSFSLSAPAARALGTLRDQLTSEYLATAGVAIADEHGLFALLTFGERLLPGEFEDGDLALLESLGSLAGRAFESLPAAGKARRPSRPARTMEVLRMQHPQLQTMVGDSRALLDTCRELIAVATVRYPVLLHGETGVGKELAARAVHELSDRADGPFEVVDCASIPRELIESEIFGHVRGAFTGAHRDRRGAFELAHRGTLFLDEIGEMPLQLQTRLLRVLQEGRVRRVGDERTIDVDVRVVAATNRDLRADVAAGRFREDLFYRLNVFAVEIPPLRERLEDLEPLMRHFLAAQSRERRGREWAIHEEALCALRQHAWPGNVRELSNLCAALAVRAADRLEIRMDEVEDVWRRQHGAGPAPWHGATAGSRGQLGAWVLKQARTAGFNLVQAERTLQRLSRAGQRVAISERSALAYYLTGEILRALVDCDGDPEAAARAIAGSEDLEPRAIPRVRSVCEALRRAGGGSPASRRQFAKLPADYRQALRKARRLVAG